MTQFLQNTQTHVHTPGTFKYARKSRKQAQKPLNSGYLWGMELKGLGGGLAVTLKPMLLCLIASQRKK